MAWQSAPKSPHWLKVNMAEKHKMYWKLCAETTRYDGMTVSHYITLVAESDEDYLEAVEFLETAEYNGLYSPATRQINLTAFERHDFAWGRIGAYGDEDFIETTRDIQFNGEIFISPIRYSVALDGGGEILENPKFELEEEEPVNYFGEEYGDDPQEVLVNYFGEEYGDELEGAPVNYFQEEHGDEFKERSATRLEDMHGDDSEGERSKGGSEGAGKIGETEEEARQQNRAEKVALGERDAAIAEKEAAEHRLVVLSFQNAEYRKRIGCLQRQLEHLRSGLQQRGNRQTLPTSSGAPGNRRRSNAIIGNEGEGEEEEEKSVSAHGRRATTDVQQSRKYRYSYDIADDEEEENVRGGKKSNPKRRRRATPDVQQGHKRHREMSSDDDEGVIKRQPNTVKRSHCSGLSKTKPASSSANNSKPKGWSGAEKSALATEMRLYNEENTGKAPKDLLRDTKLFEHMSGQLASKHGIHRSGNGCKNEWNRRGREESGIENRIKMKSKSASLSTSVQHPKGA